MYQRARSDRPRRKKVSLCVEELEGRWLLSGGLALGPDGDVWFPDGSYLGRITPSTGAEQFYWLPPGAAVVGDLAFATDGMLWMNVGNGLVRFDTTTGASEAFPFAPGRTTGMFSRLTADSNDNLWFLENSANGRWVASLNSASGVIHEYPFDGLVAMDGAVATASDGSIWFGVVSGTQVYA